MLTLLQEYMNTCNHKNYIDLMIDKLKTKLNKTKQKKMEKTIGEYGEESDIILTKYLYKELRGIGNQEVIKKEFITKMYELTFRTFLINTIVMIHFCLNLLKLFKI